jgi:hypothetical protein
MMQAALLLGVGLPLAIALVGWASRSRLRDRAFLWVSTVYGGVAVVCAWGFLHCFAERQEPSAWLASAKLVEGVGAVIAITLVGRSVRPQGIVVGAAALALAAVVVGEASSGHGYAVMAVLVLAAILLITGGAGWILRGPSLGIHLPGVAFLLSAVAAVVYAVPGLSQTEGLRAIPVILSVTAYAFILVGISGGTRTVSRKSLASSVDTRALHARAILEGMPAAAFLKSAEGTLLFEQIPPKLDTQIPPVSECMQSGLTRSDRRALAQGGVVRGSSTVGEGSDLQHWVVVRYPVDLPDEGRGVAAVVYHLVHSRLANPRVAKAAADNAALAELAEAMLIARDLPEALSLAAASARHILDSPLASAFLWDRSAQRYVPTAADASEGPPRGVVDWLCRGGEAQVAEGTDATRSALGPAADALQNPRALGTALDVGELPGQVFLWAGGREEPYSERDLALLRRIAVKLALAAENLISRRRVEELNEQLSQSMVARTAELQLAEERSKTLSQELADLADMGGPRRSRATADSFGLRELQSEAPEIVDQAEDAYAVILDRAVEMSGYKVDYDIDGALERLAGELGEYGAGPKDVVRIHRRVLERRTEGAGTGVTRTYMNEGRLTVLKLMGYLASHYRTRSLDSWGVQRVHTEQESDGEDT